MNNNFDELILKRRARGRARTRKGANGFHGHARLVGREGGVQMPRGAQTGGRKRLMGHERGAQTPRGARTAMGRARPTAPTVKGCVRA
jgi:hypothetical protein